MITAVDLANAEESSIEVNDGEKGKRQYGARQRKKNEHRGIAITGRPNTGHFGCARAERSVVQSERNARETYPSRDHNGANERKEPDTQGSIPNSGDTIPQ